MVKPIFITGAHKSGTSLLRSLLDGHPELFVIPFESHFLTSCGVKPIYSLRNENQLKYNSKADFIYRLKQNIIEYIKSNSEFSDAPSLRLNESLIFKYLDEIELTKNLPALYHDFCQSIFRSIHHEKLKNKRVVEKSVENAELAWMYNILFPDSFFIHIIRNPYANLVSIRKFKSNKSNYPSIIEPILSLYTNYKYLERNQKIINNYLVLRYEDLIREPQKYMEQISSFLRINFDKILLSSTLLGQPRKSNSMYGSQSYTITTKNLLKWEKEIQPLEIFYINQLFQDYIQKYGYEPLKHRHFLKPVKNESLTTYIRNRVFKLYLNNFA
jgi:hypothetical protein